MKGRNPACRILPSLGPESPASPQPLNCTALALTSLFMTANVMPRWKHPSPMAGSSAPQTPKSGTRVSTVLKGLKWMWRKDAPLLVNMTPSWHKLSWMAEFVRNIPNYKNNTIATTRMAIAARSGLTEMAQIAGVDFDLSPAGILHFYSKQADLDHAREVTALLREGGLQREELTPAEVKDHCPQLQGKVLGGFWTQSDMTGDIHKFTTGVAGWLARQGVTFRMGQEVKHLERDGTAIRVDGTRFDGIVLCAGVASRDFAAQLGERLNVYPVKGYSITVELNDALSQSAAPTVSLLDDAAKIVTSRLGKDRFRIAGTAEFNGQNRDIRADRIRPLVQWCEQHFPDVETENVIPWAGLRPMMPNMMPRVGGSGTPGLFFNTGHGHLGWTLSAATAGMLAGAVQTHFGAGQSKLAA